MMEVITTGVTGNQKPNRLQRFLKAVQLLICQKQAVNTFGIEKIAHLQLDIYAKDV